MEEFKIRTAREKRLWNEEFRAQLAVGSIAKDPVEFLRFIFGEVKIMPEGGCSVRIDIPAVSYKIVVAVSDLKYHKNNPAILVWSILTKAFEQMVLEYRERTCPQYVSDEIKRKQLENAQYNPFMYKFFHIDKEE